MTLSFSLLAVSVLLLISIFSSKLSLRFGVPTLLLFLGLGMLVGSDGLNFIYFNDYDLAQSIGIIALIYILFDGGLNTHWRKVKHVLAPSIILATAGVLITAIIVGFSASLILDISLAEGMLLGAIVSSTDAAAVFSILRTKAVGLKYQLKELIEFESATNDPMAIFLTVGIIEYITTPSMAWGSLLFMFVLQMSLGLIAGYVSGKAACWVINRIKLDYQGLYSVMTLSFVPLIYSVTDLLGGSGFLAVYIAGLVMGNTIFTYKNSTVSFFDGVSWLMQILVFVVLGLLVFPSQIGEIALEAMLISIVLILVARPVSVFLGTAFTKLTTKSKLMVSWVGLRGAVPIIMATYPLVHGIELAETFFAIVFFIVVISVLIQGTTIPPVARFLNVDMPVKERTQYPIELEPSVDTRAALKEVEITAGDHSVGKQVFNLGLPEKVLITIIKRDDQFIVPRGTTRIRENDRLLILSNKKEVAEIRRILKRGAETTPDDD